VELARIILTQGGLERTAKLRAAEELSWRLRQATGIAKASFVAEFVRLLVESGEQVVLYGWHRAVYDVWAERLKDLNPVLYTGEESPTQKEASKEAFVSGKSKVLIISLRAGAGLDGLQHCCRTVVFGELDWSPGVHEQCVGRVARDGQKDPVFAYYLVADHGSDPVVADVLQLKKNQIDGLRDPTAALLEDSNGAEGHIKRLAEAFLQRTGSTSTAEGTP
jgi:SNF2 family DNA or RNA helicase